MVKREFKDFSDNINIQVEIKGFIKNSFHYHNSIELIYVLEGRLEVDKVDHKYILKKDDLYIINGNDIHKLNTYEEDKNSILIAHISHGDIEKVYGNLYEEVFRCRYIKSIKNDDYLCNDRYIEEKRESVLKIKNNLLKIYLLNEFYKNTINERGMGIELKQYIEKSKVYSKEVLNLLLLEFDIKEFYRKIADLDEENLDRTYKFIQYVNENYKNKITLDLLAEEVNLSKYYISHTLNKYMPGGLSWYVNSVRTYKGRVMLLITDKSVNEISELCGFNNIGNFIKYFKEYFKMTPTEFRKKYKGIEDESISGDLSERKIKDLLKDNLGDYENVLKECKVDRDLVIDINKERSSKKISKIFINIFTENHIEDGYRLKTVDNLYNLNYSHSKFLQGSMENEINIYSNYKKLLMGIRKNKAVVDEVGIEQLITKENIPKNLYFYYGYINLLKENFVEENNDYIVTKDNDNGYSILVFLNRDKDNVSMRIKMNKDFIGRNIIEHRLDLNNGFNFKVNYKSEVERLKKCFSPKCTLRVINNEVYTTDVNNKELFLLEII